MQTDPISDQEKFVDAIKALDKALLSRFQQKIALQPTLSRALVTFQANKTRAVYRWYKYKEAFSAALVEHFINRYTISCGPILDPFAGSGTTLFAASAMGLEAEGIELLPIGQQIITARKMVLELLSDEEIARLQQWSQQPVWQQCCLEELICRQP